MSPFHRQIALKALSERLSKVEPMPVAGTSWDPPKQQHKVDTTNDALSVAVSIPEDSSPESQTVPPLPVAQTWPSFAAVHLPATQKNKHLSS